MPWSYLPHTEQDRKEMLAAIGVREVKELFGDIPAELWLGRKLKLPGALAEQELIRHLTDLAKENADLTEYVCFLGAGAYDHHIPSVVDHVLSRSEFYTAYTQYQAEISQGYLQALWEYQSMICELTGMDAANASLYDGGSGLAEAILMAAAVNGRRKILIAKTVHPHYRTVVQTYAFDRGLMLEEVGYTDGVLNMDEYKAKLGNEVAAVVMQAPNFFGCLEDMATVAEMAHAQGALLIAAVDPISLGVLESPGTLGADIVTGEGQSLGISMAFGGPYLGFMAVREKLMRKLPGRIVGQTLDQEGNRGFVLTLQAREQHIRREKATSNICSNEALCALAAAVYLSAVGKEGLGQIARLSLQKAHYTYKRLQNIRGCQTVFDAPFFKEFVIRLNKPVKVVNDQLLARRMIGGLDLGNYYPELSGCMLLCVTEKRSRQEIERLVSGVEAIL
jgi:glycine dehydrogenase subunit 1